MILATLCRVRKNRRKRKIRNNNSSSLLLAVCASSNRRRKKLNKNNKCNTRIIIISLRFRRLMIVKKINCRESFSYIGIVVAIFSNRKRKNKRKGFLEA